LICAEIQGPEEGAEKGRNLNEMPGRRPAGAEAQVHSASFSARLKSCPCYKALFGFVVSHPWRDKATPWMGHPAFHFIVAAYCPAEAVPLLQASFFPRL
jgi:hypothetical protein